jgi:predicted secreted hydrolase
MCRAGLKKIVSKSLTVVFLITVAALCFQHRFSHAQSGSEWQKAIHPRSWNFPRDHGAHREYRTEWWYFTGNLSDTAGARFGYQLTFFRFGIRKSASTNDNPWHLRDLFMGHVAITEEADNRFRFAELISREGPGLAGARSEGMQIRLLNWSAVMEDSSIHLEAKDGPLKINLTLTPLKPLVIHGADGVSIKGETAGQASFYTSFTDLATEGTIRIEPGASAIPVTGKSWFDHEFGSNQLAQDQEGWDWFALRLSDGSDVMLYRLRKKGGLTEPFSSGTWVNPDGRSQHLALKDFSLEVVDHWKSPQSGARYPATWRILIPSRGIDLLVTPLTANQELITTASTGVVYWEGAVTGDGMAGDTKITAEGYIELTGYAGSLGGIF